MPVYSIGVINRLYICRKTKENGRSIHKASCKDRSINLIKHEVICTSKYHGAQNVLMTKWGLSQQDQEPQADAEGDFDEYMALFGGLLSESKREAIRTLFPAGCAIEGIQLVEGVDLEV